MDYICDICPIPHKFKENSKTTQNEKALRDGMFSKFLTEADVSNHYLRRVICELFGEMFSLMNIIIMLMMVTTSTADLCVQKLSGKKHK